MGAGVVLLRLVLAGLRAVAVALAGVAHDDAAADGEDHVEHVELPRAAHAAVVGIGLVEHAHELGLVQHGYLGVGVFEVERHELEADVAVGKRAPG